jgi:hypothetical protein
MELESSIRIAAQMYLQQDPCELRPLGRYVEGRPEEEARKAERHESTLGFRPEEIPRDRLESDQPVAHAIMIPVRFFLEPVTSQTEQGEGAIMAERLGPTLAVNPHETYIATGWSPTSLWHMGSSSARMSPSQRSELES